MDSYIKNTGNYKTTMNGNIVDQAKWNMEYDGNNMNLEAHRNDETLYMKLSNDDIIKLLEIPASNYTMDKRLLQDKLQHIPVDPIIIRSKTRHVSNRKTKRKTSRSSPSTKRKSSRSSHDTKNSRSGLSKKKSRPTTRRTSKSNKKEDMVPEYLRTIY